jgi:hypothetical protein
MRRWPLHTQLFYQLVVPDVWNPEPVERGDKGRLVCWASLRALKITTQQLSDAVGYFTEAHIKLDPDLIPESLPVPGELRDDLAQDLLRDISRHVGLIGRLLRVISA